MFTRGVQHQEELPRRGDEKENSRQNEKEREVHRFKEEDHILCAGAVLRRSRRVFEVERGQEGEDKMTNVV